MNLQRCGKLVTVGVMAGIMLAGAQLALAQNVKLSTSMGDIVLQLDPVKAPKTVDNFVQYVKDGAIRASYAAADGLAEGRVNNLRFDGNGALWVAMESGLSQIKNGRVVTLTSRNGEVCSFDSPLIASTLVPSRTIFIWRWARRSAKAGSETTRLRKSSLTFSCCSRCARSRLSCSR